MWTRCFPSMQKVTQLLQEGVIGEVRVLNGSFGFAVDASSNPRLYEPELGGGALLDIGVYLVALSSLVFKKRPTSILAAGVLEKGVDKQVGVIFSYDSGAQAILNFGLTTDYFHNEARITGTNGSIVIHPPFHCPTSITVTIGSKVEKFDFPVPQRDHKFNFNNSIGLSYQIQSVEKAMKEGKLESDQISLQESMEIMQTMDTIREQIGLKYPTEQVCRK